MPAYKYALPSGKTAWCASFYYKDFTGTRARKLKRGFQTRRDAAAFERDFLEHLNSTPDMSFGTLVDLYLTDCTARLKPTTVANKRHIITKKLLPYFKKKAINAITPSDVRKWQNALLKEKPNINSQQEDFYSQTYVKTINAQFSSVMNFAVKYYKLPQNPVRLAGSIGQQHADRIDFWQKEEFNTFIAALSDKPLSVCCFNILFWTGCRLGELLALTPADFDFVAKTVTISKSYSRLNGQDLIQSPKTAKSKRTVSIPDFLIDIVQAHIKTLYKPKKNDRLFPVTKYYLNHEMNRGCKLSGVKKIRVHDLRHSHASLLIELGFSPLMIKERLGHEKIETTLQTYSHLYPNKQNELADKLQTFATSTSSEKK